jgi:hypothetical protein
MRQPFAIRALWGLTAALAAVALVSMSSGCGPSQAPPASLRAMTAPFPGPGDFAGGFDPASRRAADGGQSTYEGALFVAMLDSRLVAAVLPAGLELATPLTATTQHPVILLVGNQRDPRELRGGVTYPIPLANDYREAMLLVPFVVRTSANQRWHTYVVRMYLDDYGPIVIGNTIFGYEKEHATLTESGAFPNVGTDVRDAQSRIGLVFHSDVRVTGAWQASASATGVPRWADLRTIFEMPIVGTLPRVGFVCSYWEWYFASTEVAPATSSFRFVQPFRPAMSDWVALGTLTNAPDGALAMRGLRWRLAMWPPGCEF